MNLAHNSRRKGVAGIIVALVLFAMLFAIGGNYFLFVNESNVAFDQASAARLDALQQQRSEDLSVSVALNTATSNLVASLTNIGGVPTSISYVYLTDVTGKTILAPPAATNVTASHWPLTLNVGASTGSVSGCVSGKFGCGIELTGYTYATGTVHVDVVTSRGNTFSGVFPPSLGASGVSSSALVVQMVAFPTPPLTQVFSCKACVSLNVTVDNFASNPVTGIFLSPSPPTILTTGTITISNGQCSNDNSTTTTIPAYSGTGTPHHIRYTCTFDSQTGNVGGYVSFSGIAEGTLNGVLVSSAEAVSNNLQIGSNANAITQGAFSINFFFFKATSCTQSGGGNWHSPCTTNISPYPPSSPNNLPEAGAFSVGSDYYVAFYVSVTNNYPSSLEILQYSFLQFDSSYFNQFEPNTLGEGNETDFWLAGTANAYNSAGAYYPTYSTNPPTLAGYTGTLLEGNQHAQSNQVNCPETGPTWTPSTNCIDINYGQTVTLTFAACGYGSSGWDWGGRQYGRNFDSGSTGCDSSAPGWATVGVASNLEVVISYVLQGQIYAQAIQFQGEALTAP